MRSIAPSLTRRARRGSAPLMLGAAALIGLPAASASADPVPDTTTLTFTDAGCSVWAVPNGVTSIHVVAVGADGHSMPGGPLGGEGARVEADVPVTGAQPFDVCVDQDGGAGGAGTPADAAGNDGGGYSAVRSGSTPWIIAAGGGGAGGALGGPEGSNSNGGDAGTVTAEPTAGNAYASSGGGMPARADNPGWGGEGGSAEGMIGSATHGGGGGAGDVENGGGGGGGGGGAYGGGGGAGGTTGNYGGGGGGGWSGCYGSTIMDCGGASNGDDTPQVVISYAKVATTTTVTGPDYVVGPDDTVNFDVTVAPLPTDSPRGTVRFMLDGDEIGGCAATPLFVSSEFATTNCMTSAPDMLGEHHVTAVYSGSTSFAGSTSTTFDFTVGEPVASLSADHLDFGDTLVGATAEEQTVTVTNTGQLWLQIGDPPSLAPHASVCLTAAGCRPSGPGVVLGGAHPDDYAIAAQDCDPTSLGSGESCSVTVVFRPSATGARPATLEFTTNTGDSPVTVALNGVGIVPQEPEERTPDTTPQEREPETRIETTPTPTPTPAPPVTPTTPPATQATPPATAAVLAPSARGRAFVTPAGTVTLPLSCPSGDVCDVSGSLTLSAGAFASKARTSAAKVQVLARFSGITVKGNQVRTLRLRLPRSFVKAAQKAGKRSVRATLTITTRLGSGRSITKRQQVTLILPRARKAQAPKPAKVTKPATRPSFTG